MNAAKLKKLQQESRRRYLGLAADLEIMVPKEKPKTMREVLDEHFNFIDGELVLKERYKKRQEKKIMPDLMAAQISVPSTSDKTTETKVMEEPKKTWPTVHDKPHVPQPVQEKKRSYFMSKAVTPEPPKQREERPPATYTNSKSPYGIYDELKKEWE